MKAARMVVLAVALGAGGIASDFAGGSKGPPLPAAARVILIETTDNVAAKDDIDMGLVVSRSPIDAKSPTPRPDDGKTANRRLAMVRSGVTTSVTPK
jgi:pilus assembly protein CpaB